jgi:hypothetical protein
VCIHTARDDVVRLAVGVIVADVLLTPRLRFSVQKVLLFWLSISRPGLLEQPETSAVRQQTQNTARTSSPVSALNSQLWVFFSGLPHL